MKSKIMKAAWTIARTRSVDFSYALWLAWLAAKINGMSIRNAKVASGVTEETDTYMGWKERGYEVIHGSKALFGCDLVYITKNTTYKARFFGASQVQKIA